MLFKSIPFQTRPWCPQSSWQHVASWWESWLLAGTLTVVVMIGSDAGTGYSAARIELETKVRECFIMGHPSYELTNILYLLSLVILPLFLIG